jgi:hypothetical protein
VGARVAQSIPLVVRPRYSDYCGGFLRSFRYAFGQAIERIDWGIPDIGRVISFGEDSNREVYVITASGKIYRIVKQ